MRKFIVPLVILITVFSACEKLDLGGSSKLTSVTHLKGFRTSTMFLPLGKIPWGKPSLKYLIRFNSSCLYPPLPVNPVTGADENASWNKLMYFGTADPHDKATDFGWRHYKGKLQLSARVYDHCPGQDINHLVVWETDIRINTEYLLEQRNEFGKHYWYFNNQKVAEWYEVVPGEWLSQPFFGGGDGLPWQGNVAPQDISFDISIL